jgi:hypothetical protein
MAIGARLLPALAFLAWEASYTTPSMSTDALFEAGR